VPIRKRGCQYATGYGLVGETLPKRNPTHGYGSWVGFVFGFAWPKDVCVCQHVTVHVTVHVSSAREAGAVVCVTCL
jgi:hypothetical protein